MKKVKILLSPTLPPPHFSSPFFKTFVTHPSNINELDTVVTHPCPPTLTPPKIWNVHRPVNESRPIEFSRPLTSITLIEWKFECDPLLTAAELVCLRSPRDRIREHIMLKKEGRQFSMFISENICKVCSIKFEPPSESP